MTAKTKKLYPWIARAILLAVLALMCASLFHFRDFRAYGVWYRKRVALYMLPTLVFCALSLVYPRVLKWNRPKLFRTALMIGGIVISTFMFQRMTWGITWAYPVKFDSSYILYNVSLVAMFAAFLWIFLWDVRMVIPVLYWILFFCAYFYHCVYLFRGAAFKPMDLLTIQTGLAVADQYHFPIKSKTFFWAAFGVCLSVFSAWNPPKKKDRAGKWTKAVSIVLAGIWFCVVFFTSYVDTIDLTTTAWEELAEHYNAKQGTLATLTKEVWELRKNKPQDYQAAELQKADERLLEQEAYVSAQTKPNVIVIVNESLSDMTSLWQIEVAENKDPLAFLHSLKEQSISGNLYVSVYGGSTCNTEHNFLTGTIPTPELYLPLFPTIRSETPSLIWQLKALDYTTVAMHPEKRKNYQRDVMYPRLGFDDFLSMESEPFQNAPKLRDMITDQATYDVLISLFEEKKPGEPLMVYDLTMQNHAGYLTGQIAKPFDVLNETIQQETEDRLEEYLALMNESDRAFEQLVSYFETYEEPTIILIFGDHQGNTYLEGVDMAEDLSELEQALTQYITPFVIWANYPIESEHIEAVSINYLAALLMEKSGLPLTSYDRWQLEMMEKYPVVVQSGYADSEGHFHTWDEQEWPEELQLMNHVRYNRLYDSQNRLPALEFVGR